MPPKPIMSQGDYVRYKYVSTTRSGSSGASVSIPLDPEKNYLLIAINFCTANGTATTTDTVTTDNPYPNLQPGTSILWEFNEQDNSGDEGTGIWVKLISITERSVVNLTAQTTEDFNGFAGILFEDLGAAKTPPGSTFTSFALIGGDGGSSDIGSHNIIVENTSIGRYTSYAAATSALDETGRNTWIFNNFSIYSSMIFVFYHGYGTGFSDPENTAVLFENGVEISPTFRLQANGQILSSESAHSITVFSGNQIQSASAELTLRSDSQFSQGDHLVMLHF